MSNFVPFRQLTDEEKEGRVEPRNHAHTDLDLQMEAFFRTLAKRRRMAAAWIYLMETWDLRGSCWYPDHLRQQKMTGKDTGNRGIYWYPHYDMKQGEPLMPELLLYGINSVSHVRLPEVPIRPFSEWGALLREGSVFTEDALTIALESAVERLTETWDPRVNRALEVYNSDYRFMHFCTGLPPGYEWRGSEVYLSTSGYSPGHVKPQAWYTPKPGIDYGPDYTVWVREEGGHSCYVAPGAFVAKGAIEEHIWTQFSESLSRRWQGFFIHDEVKEDA